MKLSFGFSALSACLCAALIATQANAASYADLNANGFKVGKMSRNGAGTWGWKLTKGSESYFCKLGVATIRKNKDTLLQLTTAGRMISMSEKIYEEYAGNREYPTLANLQAGKLRPQDVGSCAKAK